MGGSGVSGGNGLIVLLSADADSDPLWWKLVDGHIVSRSQKGALAGLEADAGAVMIAVPPEVATIRHVEVDAAMPPAQARAVALRRALESTMADAADMHGALLDHAGDAPQGIHHVALIARADLAHVIAWGRHHGIDADIILPIGAVLPEPEAGYVRTAIGGSVLLRGQGVVARDGEPWVQAMLAGATISDWPTEAAETALIAALEKPPVNLRSGAFAKARASGIDARYLKRIALWTAFIALVTLLISLVLIGKYEWSAARLDAKTIEVAKSVLPAASDAEMVGGELDRMLGEKGAGAQMFAGPLAGLMTAMQPVPGVSLSALSLQEDGLLHATLASARAEDINAVLLAVQGAGYSITATSTTDPGGRVVAQITVRP